MIDSTEPAIDLQHVTRRFGRTTAVSDLSLRVAAGQTFGFIGLNGAGKTTTIRMMVGLLAPHGGTIRVAGCEIPGQRDAMKSQVGYVPDRPNVYSWMHVAEAISFCKSLYPTWNGSYVAELLKTFDLDLSKRVKHLSKGMAAKLQLLLALGHDPKILILDEPMSGLDPLVREEFLEGLVAAVAERGQTVLFSSHTLSDVQRLADSIGLLHEGRLLLHSPIDQLLDKTKRIRAVLKDSARPMATPPGVIWQKANGREWMLTVENFSRTQVEFLRDKNSVENVDVLDLSLDDVFKDYVRGQQAKETL
ncbi:MAG TPA: ABC transporter ATP-binding protein [Tepidisphaeraceae bacterium]|nr:ABC transporter ATP-binding protein [Tepidisphaeraceae bacterium]